MQSINAKSLELWQRIEAYSLDDPSAEIPFSQKLARENGWTNAYTQRVIEEYKKFTFLAAISKHTVTPSEPVDRVWHLHLTYSQFYWNEFCSKILETPLHHNPSRGGRQERDRYYRCYTQTLSIYEQIFQQQPPANIWHPPRIRFRGENQFVRVNTKQNWIVPKPSLKVPRFHLKHFVLFFTLPLLITCSSPLIAKNLTTYQHLNANASQITQTPDKPENSPSPSSEVKSPENKENPVFTISMWVIGGFILLCFLFGGSDNSSGGGGWGIGGGGDDGDDSCGGDGCGGCGCGGGD